MMRHATPKTRSTSSGVTTLVGAPSLARIDTMNPARILAPGFFAQGCPDLIRIHADGQGVARGGPQRGEVEIGNIRAAEG